MKIKIIALLAALLPAVLPSTAISDEETKQNHEVKILETALNGIKDLTTAKAQKKAILCAKMKKEDGLINEYLREKRNERLTPLISLFMETYQQHCEKGEIKLKESDTSVTPETTSGEDTAIKEEETLPNLGIWTTEPYCKNDPSNIFCSYNHSKGKGIFILKRPSRAFEEKPAGDNQELSHYLVCALNAGSFYGFFHSGYRIDYTCRKSTVDYEKHLKLKLEEDDGKGKMRSDVKGLMAWANRRGKRIPLPMPAILLDQCQTAFADSYYCTPYFMVLPTDETDQVDVCGLTSKGDGIRIPFFKYFSQKSRWRCKRTDLAKKIERRDLTSQESHCIPNRWGYTHARCNLPYIPEIEGEVKVRGKFSFAMSRAILGIGIKK